jgi:hypothetical protein
MASSGRAARPRMVKSPSRSAASMLASVCSGRSTRSRSTAVPISHAAVAAAA